MCRGKRGRGRDRKPVGRIDGTGGPRVVGWGERERRGKSMDGKGGKYGGVCFGESIEGDVG